MSEITDLAGLYRETRQRLTVLLSGLDPSLLTAAVPACPGWAVRDVLAHLVSIPEDAAAGRLTDLPTEEFTAGQVARLADVPVPELLARWSESGPVFERAIAAHQVWPAVIDLATHEQDIRGAVNRPGARDCAAIRQAIGRLMTSLGPPVPVRIVTEDDVYLVGKAADPAPADPAPADPASGSVPLTLTTSRFEAFRWRMGRRSRAQLAAMDWSAEPPATVLAELPIFGPATVDVRE